MLKKSKIKSSTEKQSSAIIVYQAKGTATRTRTHTRVSKMGFWVCDSGGVFESCTFYLHDGRANTGCPHKIGDQRLPFLLRLSMCGLRTFVFTGIGMKKSYLPSFNWHPVGTPPWWLRKFFLKRDTSILERLISLFRHKSLLIFFNRRK